MNVVFSILIISGILFSVVSGTERLGLFTKGIFEGAKSAVEISFWLLGIVSLWMGLLKILEDSGFISAISRWFEPIVSRLFKNIPKGHPAISSITMNFLANLFGLGNAATPIGIKAMNDLKNIHHASQPDTLKPSRPDDTEITFEMMLFIVINTASIQLIPFTVVGILAEGGSSAPQRIILPTIIATTLSAICAILILMLARKLTTFKDKK